MCNLILRFTIGIITLLFFIPAAYAQWNLLNFPSNVRINDIVVQDFNLFATTEGDGIFLSTDEGITWRTVNTGLTNTKVELLGVSDSIILAATANPFLVFKSTNDGLNWILANSGLPQIGVWSFVNSEANFFAGTQDSGIYLTTNNGLNWNRTDTGQIYNLTNEEPIDLAFNGNSLFAGLSNYGGVGISNDYAKTWNKVLLGFWVQALSVCNGNVFAGTDYHGVFRSTNQGLSWSQVNTGLTTLDIAAFGISNTNLFSGTLGGGVFLSQDNGASWNAVNEGLTNLIVFNIAISDSNVFISTYNNIWRRPLAEMILITNVQSGLPAKFVLEQNYPNPFNLGTSFRFKIPQRSYVRLEIFNNLGQKVTTVVDEEKEAGDYEISWNAIGLSSGIYFYKLAAGTFAETKKLIILK
jgi:photosystem II stability/assembly factor-like uncharacterized protein